MILSKAETESPASTLQALGHDAFGPVLLQFQAWLAAQAKREGVNRLYFLSREGYFLQLLYDAFRQLGLADKDLPEPRYLLASRRMAFGAAKKTPESLRYMLECGPYSGGLHKLLEGRIGLDAHESSALGLTDEQVEMPRHGGHIVSKLLSHLTWLNDKAAQERRGLLEYLRKVGFLEERNGLVDLGYSGSIQRYLHEIAECPLTGFYFATTTVVDDWQHSRNRVLSCFGTGCGPDAGPPVYRYSLALESWLTSPDGQLLYFTEDGQAVFGPTGRMQNAFEVARAIVSGVRLYFEEVATLEKCGANWQDGLAAVCEPTMEHVLRSGRYEADLRLLSVQDFFFDRAELSVADRVTGDS